MLPGFVSLSQIAQGQPQRVMRRAVFGKQFNRLPEMRGGGMIAARGFDTSQTVMRLRYGGVFLDDVFIKRKALKLLTGRKQSVGQSELRRKIIGPPADGLFENNRRFAVFA